MYVYQKIIAAILFIALTISLAGCEEMERSRRFLSEYSEPFKEQAKVQYGAEAEVSIIRNEAISDGAFAHASGNLIGQVEIDGQKFEAIFYPKSGRLLSDKNIKIITASMIEFYADVLNAEIYGGQLWDICFGRDNFYLPDEVETYEQLLAIEGYKADAIILITDDIDDWDETRFLKVIDYVGDKGIQIRVRQTYQGAYKPYISNASFIIDFEYTKDGEIEYRATDQRTKPYEPETQWLMDTDTDLADNIWFLAQPTDFLNDVYRNSLSSDTAAVKGLAEAAADTKHKIEDVERILGAGILTLEDDYKKEGTWNINGHEVNAYFIGYDWTIVYIFCHDIEAFINDNIAWEPDVFGKIKEMAANGTYPTYAEIKAWAGGIDAYAISIFNGVINALIWNDGSFFVSMDLDSAGDIIDVLAIDIESGDLIEIPKEG